MRVLLMTYHEGEREVQERAGARDLASRVGRIIGGSIPPVAANFLAAQPMLVAATVAQDGSVTSSLLGGEPGFATPLDATSIRITPRFGNLERVRSDLLEAGMIGLLAIEPDTRRRMRVNGHGSVSGDDILVTAREVYSNCPQYIQQRRLSTAENPAPTVTHEGKVLTGTQQSVIRAADTFFIASAHPIAGADSSHRGGTAGFVRVEDETHLWFPDYSGNNMFNTLGNLHVKPRSGLLFVDFERGATLQLRGRSWVRWDDPRQPSVAGAQRIVDFEVEEVSETFGFPFQWSFVSPSPLNP